MKLSVPYYSQYIDIENRFWMLRGCGGLCFRMVVEFYGKSLPADFISFCKEAKEHGGYDMKNGWVHNYLIAQAEKYGLQAYRKEGLKDITLLLEALDKGFPVIVSVEKRLLEQKRYHLITLVGYQHIPDSKIFDGTFYYHETEATSREAGAFKECSFATFLEYWRGKAIFISPQQ